MHGILSTGCCYWENSTGSSGTAQEFLEGHFELNSMTWYYAPFSVLTNIVMVHNSNEITLCINKLLMAESQQSYILSVAVQCV